MNLAHNRHLSAEKCREIGLKIFELESDQRLQDKVLSVHHIYSHTLSSTGAFKIIENHKGIAFILQTQQVLLAGSPTRMQSDVPDAPTPPPPAPVPGTPPTAD